MNDTTKNKVLELRGLSSNLNILFVDDNKQLLEDYEQFAKRLFDNITISTNSKDVVETYKDSQYDIIYTDINMPEVNGIELIEAIRRINPLQHFIVLSGSNDAENLIKLLEIGISTFILKPFKAENFIDSTYNVVSTITQKKKLQKDTESLKKTLSNTIQEKEQQEMMLIQQSKLAQTGEMISMIAHQWRQPLSQTTAVIAKFNTKIDLGIYEDEAYLKDDLLAEVKDMLQKIEHSTLHLSKTIDDFRNFYRPDSSAETYSINNALKETLDISMFSNGVNIEETFCNNNLTLINGFEGQFKQIILNLLNNARDAFNENNISQPKITITTIADENNITIDISDNAGGIKEDIIDKIFLPYFSTKDKQHGTGIGLHMVKTIVEKNMKGSISVRNIQDGVLFSINLDKNALITKE